MPNDDERSEQFSSEDKSTLDALYRQVEDKMTPPDVLAGLPPDGEVYQLRDKGAAVYDYVDLCAASLKMRKNVAEVAQDFLTGLKPNHLRDDLTVSRVQKLFENIGILDPDPLKGLESPEMSRDEFSAFQERFIRGDNLTPLGVEYAAPLHKAIREFVVAGKAAIREVSSAFSQER